VSLIRANLAAFFIVGCLMSLVVLAPVGLFGMRQILLSIPLWPAKFAGFLIAQYTMKQLPHRQLRLGSLALCSLSGLAAVLSFWF